jgi:hypothetical protein
MITRRCTQRQFLLRPDRETNNAFIYCLATAAKRHGIEVLFTIAMSNHHHTGIHDVAGNYPEFLEYFHKLLAKCQNARYGRHENFWSSEQTSVVLLSDKRDVLARLIYALTNPVKDHLVERAQDWPGVTSLPCAVAEQALTATRPRHFFRDDGEMPEVATLTFHQPKAFEHLTAQEYGAMVSENIKRVEDAATAARRLSGRRVLGRAKILRQDWRDRPRAPSQKAAEASPASQWTRVEALLRSRVFRDAYVAAREALQTGVRDVVFPAGTYWLRRFAQVVCAAAPPSPA